MQTQIYHSKQMDAFLELLTDKTKKVSSFNIMSNDVIAMDWSYRYPSMSWPQKECNVIVASTTSGARGVILT